MIKEIHTPSDLMRLISEVGFLPLLDSGIKGFSADEIGGEECRYIVYPDGGWDWPLWKWKGPVVIDMPCVYGKFFNRKAGFISMEWWPHFINWRRHIFPAPEPDSIEEMILLTLREAGSLITRELRAECGFTGPKMRSKFDAYITRLEMACRIVTEDFVYPRDRHGNPYGWGWSLLTTPERLYGQEACRADCSPEKSLDLIMQHLREQLPSATDRQLRKLIG